MKPITEYLDTIVDRGLWYVPGYFTREAQRSTQRLHAAMAYEGIEPTKHSNAYNVAGVILDASVASGIAALVACAYQLINN